MKQRGSKNLELIPCPSCKSGQAVNKSRAWVRYNSTKYVRLRKTGAKINKKKLPVVVRNASLDAAMRNPDWVKSIRPPASNSRLITLDNLLDSKLFRWLSIGLPAILGFIIINWLEEHGLEAREARNVGKLLIIALVIFIIVVWIYIDSWREDAVAQRSRLAFQEYQKAWICLQCGKEFLRN